MPPCVAQALTLKTIAVCSADEQVARRLLGNDNIDGGNVRGCKLASSACCGCRAASDSHAMLADAEEGGDVPHEIRRIEEVLCVDRETKAQDDLGASHNLDAGSSAAQHDVELVLWRGEGEQQGPQPVLASFTSGEDRDEGT